MDKERLILIPGWGMPPDVWLPISDNLSAYFDLSYVDWHDVETIDGFNEKALRTVFAQQNQPLSLLGWSLGALVALTIAAEYPERITRLILFGGTSRFTIDKTGGYHGGWPWKVVEKMRANIEKNKKDTLLTFYNSLFSAKESENNEVRRFLELFGDRLLNQPIHPLLAGLDYLMKMDCRDKLKLIKAPLLLIHGAQDRICPVKAAEYIQSKVTTKTWYNLLPEAGHIPFFTNPEICVRAVRHFYELTVVK